MKHAYIKPTSTPISFAAGKDLLLAASKTEMGGSNALSNEREYHEPSIWSRMDENEE